MVVFINNEAACQWLYGFALNRPGVSLQSRDTVCEPFAETRGGEHPRNFLAGFKGYLHVDGYPGYHKVADVTLVACWAHARRKYDEALKAAPPEARNNPETVAKQGLKFCNELFAIERDLKEASQEERYTARQERSLPVIEAYQNWLKQQRSRTLPKSLTGQAIAYSLNQWEKLAAYLADGRLEIDNNRSERSIKPFVIGRKIGSLLTPREAQRPVLTFTALSKLQRKMDSSHSTT